MTSGDVVAVGAVIFDAEGRLLLVQRARPPSKGLWSLPGGRVEPGESLSTALVREIREETGLEVEPGPLVATVRRGPFVIHDFRAARWAGQPVPGDDATAVVFADGLELRRLELVPLLFEFLEEHGCLPIGA